MISFGSCIYPTLGSVKVSPSRVASPENYKHQTLKVSGVTPNYLMSLSEYVNFALGMSSGSSSSEKSSSQQY